jgi:deaminated glutathione amidase
MTDVDRPELRIGLAQWHATDDVAANLVKAEKAIELAAGGGAEVVLLPENGLMLATGARMREEAFEASSAAISTIAAAARRNGLAVILGGLKFREGGRITNRALVFDASGQLAGSYDKIHLFDARVGGQSFEASRIEEPGSEPVIVAIGEWRLGLTICYDVRFPELYRGLALGGADVLLVPAAFTRLTGQAHWETLLRARAIENGCYVVASATVTPVGHEGDAFETYGHALVVDPWGVVLEDLKDQDGVVVIVTLSREAVDKARSSLPVLEQCRPDAYMREVRTIALTNGVNRVA